MSEAVDTTLRRFGLGDEDRRAWRRSELPADAFEDWLTDRVARRPWGRRAREVYGAEDVHEFARRAVLAALALSPGERLLEVGCGGGLLLRDALRSGAAVTGVDHSEEMVALARERAPGARVLLADAHALPFGRDSFDAVALAVVLFLPRDPAAALRQCRRVAGPGARLAVYTTPAELRGTPAAPEPLAGRGHFFSDGELVRLAAGAGFDAARVVRDGGAQLLLARAPERRSGAPRP